MQFESKFVQELVLLEQIAAIWAASLSFRLNLDTQESEVLQFAIAYALIFFINFILIILFGVLFGVLSSTLIAAVSAAVFRLFTGGAHFSTAEICALLSSLIAVGCGWVSSLLPTFFHPLFPLFLIGATFYLILHIHRYAPVESAGRPIEEFERLRFRTIAFGLVPCWVGVVILLFAVQPALAYASILAVSWQAFTLTPKGLRVYEYMDKTVRSVFAYFQTRRSIV